MINILKNYVGKNNFYIIITNEYIYINNYINIIKLTDNFIKIEIDCLYEITGYDFKIIESIDQELKITGKVESIRKYDY